MGDFFYRQGSVSIPEGGRIRNNAYVTVSTDTFTLPTGASSMSETYNPNGTGRAAPILKSVKLKLEGTAGSLRRGEVEFLCYDLPSFEAAEEALLKPDTEVTISYGYVGPEQPGGSGSHTMTIYDYSFTITKENHFDCSFKCVGKGGEYEEFELSVGGVFPNKTFVTNYNWGNDTAKVGNLFDWIDYSIQKATGTLNSSGFNPGHGTGGELPLGGHYGVIVAPDDYDPPSKMKTGVGTAMYLQYISLKGLVEMVNHYVLMKASPKYKIKFHPDFCYVSTDYPSGKVFSPDPVMMIFPYAKGTSENNYSKDGDEGPSLFYLSADTFKGIGRLSSTKSSPENILLGRDTLRAIQQAFTDEAAQADNATEEADKPTGGIPVIRFFNKIFATIKENTGGAWDLYLDQGPEDTTANPQIIQVVNRMSPGGGVVTPIEIDPVGGENGVRELSLKAKVPKATQAKMFGSAPSTTSQEEQAVSVVSGEEEPEPPDPPQTVKEQCLEARKGIDQNKYNTDAVSKGKAAIKALVTELSVEERAKRGDFKDGMDVTQVPFPLEFEATMDGVEGFEFGDAITTSYLPSRYRDASGAAKVVFTVTKYEHEISNNDWTTTVTAIMRMR
tara:strand:+ start:3332 stop:5173 length:1842 start_codon:yes stop_codon:yes gene_type:complete